MLTRWLMIRAYKEERFLKNIFEMVLADAAGSNLRQVALHHIPVGQDSSALTASHLLCWHGGSQGTKLPSVAVTQSAVLPHQRHLCIYSRSDQLPFPIKRDLAACSRRSMSSWNLTSNSYPSQIHAISLTMMSYNLSYVPIKARITGLQLLNIPVFSVTTKLRILISQGFSRKTAIISSHEHTVMCHCISWMLTSGE